MEKSGWTFLVETRAREGSETGIWGLALADVSRRGLADQTAGMKFTWYQGHMKVKGQDILSSVKKT